MSIKVSITEHFWSKMLLLYDVVSWSDITPFILYLAVKSMHIKTNKSDVNH